MTTESYSPGSISALEMQTEEHQQPHPTCFKRKNKSSTTKLSWIIAWFVNLKKTTHKHRPKNSKTVFSQVIYFHSHCNLCGENKTSSMSSAYCVVAQLFKTDILIAITCLSTGTFNMFSIHVSMTITGLGLASYKHEFYLYFKKSTALSQPNNLLWTNRGSKIVLLNGQHLKKKKKSMQSAVIL